MPYKLAPAFVPQLAGEGQVLLMKPIDLAAPYATSNATLADLPSFDTRIEDLVAPGEDVALAGPGWLYYICASRNCSTVARGFSIIIPDLREQPPLRTMTRDSENATKIPIPKCDIL